MTTKEHFYHVGGKESNRNAIYEALLSNIPLLDGISNSAMKSRIASNETQRTSKPKGYSIHEQLSLALEEQKRPTMSERFSSH